jgi:hypothetical protein
LRHDGGADADQGAFPNFDISPQMRAGRNVRVRPDGIVMIHRAASVQHNVVANHRASVDHNSSKNDGADADACIWRNGCVGMDD